MNRAFIAIKKFILRNKMKLVKPTILLICVVFLTSCIGSGSNSVLKQINRPELESTVFFPSLTANNLAGEEVDLPTAFTADKNLVIVAFAHKQQADVDTWIKALPEINQQLPNVNFYEVPVISEGSALFRFTVNNGMRSGVTDPVARKRTITVFTDRDAFTNRLGIKNISNIYALIVDKNGVVLNQQEGTYSKEKLMLLKKSFLR